MSTENIDQMSGMVQVIMSTPTQKELDDAAEAKMQSFVGPSNIIAVPSIGTVIPAASALASNDIIRLSKHQKMRMAHRGFKAIDQVEPWVTAPTYANVAGTWKYVAPQARPSLVMATTDDGYTYTTPGTFSDVTGFKTEDYNGDPLIPYEDNRYNDNWSSSSVNDGLIEPTVPALIANQVLVGSIINDMPGRTGGVSMTGENFLSFPGNPVVTSLTSEAAFAKIEAMRSANGGTATALTSSDLLACGISDNTIDWTANSAVYKSYITAATSVITAQTLQQLLVTVNNLP
jgi:hypothetical protein